MADLLKIVFIVLVILLLIKKKWDLSLVLFLGALLTGVLFGLPVRLFAESIFFAAVSGETLSLIGIILLVLYLGNFLQSGGNFRMMVDALKGLIPEPRLVLALPPSFIGLLPMLGGALVSAPIVDEAGRRWNLSPAWKTFLNYWFRHIWEYSWPLYLNIILASAILKISIKKICAFQFPWTILAACLGLVILFKRVPRLPREANSHTLRGNLYRLIYSMWPIILAIILIFGFKIDMLIALALTFLLTQVLSKTATRERWKIIRKSFSFKIVALLVSVMIFKNILEVSGALNSVTQVFRPEGISAYLLLFAAPFLLGFLTGVNHAFVGISFPLLLPIIGHSNPDLVLVMFAYVSGFAGILLSPAHLCLVLTVDYFRAHLRDVYRILIWPVLVVWLSAFLVLLFSRIL